MGDSITAGYTDNPAAGSQLGWTVPFEFGWRCDLFELLTNSGEVFQYVGESPEPWNDKFGVVTNIPCPDLRDIFTPGLGTGDQDHHEGYGAEGTAFILSNIGTFLTDDQPDVILLMIGINDIPEGSSAAPTIPEINLSNIVETVVSSSPDTYLIVAQITPYASYTPAIVQYNNYIANTLVPYFASQGDLVSTVDQYTNLCSPGTTNIDPSLYANGLNHPIASSYDLMAQTWFAGIQGLGLLPPPTMTIQQTTTNTIQITWTQGILLQAPNVTGPWTTNSTATSPYVINPTAPQMFYSVVAP